MDDICDSVHSVQQAKRLTTELDEVLLKGGFQVKGWLSNQSDLLTTRLEPFTLPFYYTACDYFGPYKVKISRNTTTKHFGVIFTCMNSRAIHLELAVDYSTYAETILRYQRTTCADDE